MAKQETRRPGTGSQGGGSSKVLYAILGLVVIVGAGWLFLADGGDSQGTVELTEITDLTGVEADPSVGLVLGPENAPVTILEFADYSCPHCAQFASFTGRLLRQNYVEGDGSVRWVMYDYVLGGFPNSLAASLAARCAGEQGQYWTMHDLLLGRQPSWAQARSPEQEFRSFADEIGLDRGRYDDCMSERRPLKQVAAARRYGDELGVNSTPTLFFNGRLLRPEEAGYEVIERLIQAAVDSASAATDGGEE